MPLINQVHDIEVRDDTDFAAITKQAKDRLHLGSPGRYQPKRYAGKYKLENVQLIGDRAEPQPLHKKECRWCRFKKCFGKCKKDLI